jgi:hypothetical protein
MVLVRGSQDLGQDVDDTVQSDTVNDFSLDTVDLQGSPRSAYSRDKDTRRSARSVKYRPGRTKRLTRHGEDLGLVNRNLDRSTREDGAKVPLEVERRIVLDPKRLELVSQPRLLVMVVVLVVTVVVVGVPVALSSDLVNGLGEDDVRLDKVVSEDPPHGIVTEGGKEEELELLGKLLERLGGREEGGDSRGASEDGVVLLLGFPRGELPSDILFLMDLSRPTTKSISALLLILGHIGTHLLDSSGKGIKLSSEEGSVENTRRRQQRVVDLVQVTVDGLPVRVSGDDLGVEVELERGRNELLLKVDPERLAVIGTELGVKGGANRKDDRCQSRQARSWRKRLDSRNGLVVGQLGSRQRLRKSVVLQDLSQDELEDPLLLLLVVLIVVSMTTTVVIIPLVLLHVEEPVTVQLVHLQEVVERRADFESLDGLVERGKVGVVVVAVMRIRNTGVL